MDMTSEEFSEALPRAAFATSRLVIRPVDDSDVRRLQEIFEACGDYFVALTGRPDPEPDAAEREVRASRATPDRSAALLMIDDTEPVGALGWWERHPDHRTALVGLLMVIPERRRSGLAREALDGLAERLSRRGIERLHAAIPALDEGGARVLEALGFRPLDERRHVDVPQGRLMMALFERSTNRP